MAKRKTEKDYHELAGSRGFKWLGEVMPESTKSKTKWQCNIGHKWETMYDSIKSKGSGCPYCAGVVKKTKQDYFELAEVRCFEWVGYRLPKHVHMKTMWKCKKGHIWEATYNKIKYGRSCPYCAGLARKTEKDYHLLAKSCGFKWVGIRLPRYIIDKTEWLCSKGHKFKSTYNKVQQGRGCPKCSNTINGLKISKPQIKLNNLLYGSLNYPEAKYRIDVAIMRKSQKIAVEYDAQYWHQGREKYDAKRDKYLVKKGWKVLHVKSSHLLPTRKQLKTTINHLLKTENKVYNLYLKDWK